jgi:YHS domain-containing protein
MSHEDFYVMDPKRCRSILFANGRGWRVSRMSGLVSFLLFGALFFVMMRFGCGAHVGHGGHGGNSARHGDKSDQAAAASAQHALDAGVDPVCGMNVEPGTGYASVYQNRTMRFCSRDCLDKFEGQPQRYLGAAAMGEGMPGSSSKR